MYSRDASLNFKSFTSNRGRHPEGGQTGMLIPRNKLLGCLEVCCYLLTIGKCVLNGNYLMTIFFDYILKRSQQAD